MRTKSRAAVRARTTEEASENEEYWERIRDHEHGFFRSQATLWRLSLPRGASFSEPAAISEWAGAQVWFKSEDAEAVAALAAEHGGYAEPFGRFAPPADPVLRTYMSRVKDAFDPKNVLNPGVWS